MKRLVHATYRSQPASGWDATVRAAAAVAAGGRFGSFAMPRTTEQGVTINRWVPGRGSA